MTSKLLAPTEIQWIDVDLIKPNQFNPNQMTKQQFLEFAAEIEHLGEVPQPIVVRRIADNPEGKLFEIIDGAHRHRAKIERGDTKVPVVILEIDEHEAMRQCYKRNRGGRDNKVKLGHMFEKMQTGMGLSRRQLSKEIHVPESTLRLAEDYARAAQLRTACAPDTAELDIARLSHPQVAHYRNLPSSVRDKWLDAGGHLNAFENRSKFTGDMLAGCLHEFGLAPYLQPGFDFVDSIQTLAGLVEWCDEHRQVAGVAQYAEAVAELQLSAQVINAVPFRREGDKLEVAIALPVWRNALTTLRATCGTRNREIIGANAAVRTALEKAGIELASVLGHAEVEAVIVVSRAPKFIKAAATFLTLQQQRWLTEVDSDSPADQGDLILQAKEQTCRVIEKEGRCTDNALEGAYRRQTRELRRCLSASGANEDDSLVTSVVSRVMASSQMRCETIDGRSASEVLRERLDAYVPWPELKLVVALISGDPALEEAVSRWLDEVRQQPEGA